MPASGGLPQPLHRFGGRFDIMELRIGTAGWSIPRAIAEAFAGEGPHLARYARVLPAAEINSSFHRPHSAATYRKWAAATPSSFRFAVKLPRSITHEGALRRARVPLERFLDESAGLGDKRGPLLMQLPPKFAFDGRVVARFLELLRARVDGDVVCEPRHASWFAPRAEALLREWRIARVAADPPRAADGDRPGGWAGLRYWRLHGSPRVYWSRYEAEYLEGLAAEIRSSAAPAWCIFDNTASGAAAANALELASRLL
jgi:uncharacterized protein YecE (DUF72 family)